MEEIKSTIVGITLIALGSFFIYISINSKDLNLGKYFIEGCFSLIVFGVYLMFTSSETRKKHITLVISKAKEKFTKKK